uniref:Uncharacterized protein n=1 Tax=Rhizophagus irregularis (strain DAOM 181602 / DAOM 197198 / MUCL 43194) TaxID=747089 RepID=U9U6Z9_RHIID
MVSFWLPDRILKVKEAERKFWTSVKGKGSQKISLNFVRLRNVIRRKDFKTSDEFQSLRLWVLRFLNKISKILKNTALQTPSEQNFEVSVLQRFLKRIKVNFTTSHCCQASLNEPDLEYSHFAENP